MGSTIIRPNAEGALNFWTPNSGTTHYNRVSETTADDDTTYLSTGTQFVSEQFGMTAISPSLPSGAVITAVVQTFRYRKEATGTSCVIGSEITIAGTQYFGGTITLVNDTSYHNDTVTWTTDPSTGVAWTESGVNGAQFGFYQSDANATVRRVTQMYVTVFYTTTATKDVAEDAALSATGTKDVAADAATTAPATKDVATAAATTATVTLDLATAAVVTTTNTKDVAEAAAIQTTVTLDLAEAAAVTTVGTKDVAEAAAVSTTGTKDVGTDASISTGTVVTLGLATAAAVGFTYSETDIIRADLDDGNSDSVTGNSFNNPPNFFVNLGSVYTGYFRFDKLPPPPGATIVSASLHSQMQTPVDGTSQLNVLIRASAEDNAATPASHTDIDGKTRTSASAPWVQLAPSSGLSQRPFDSADFANVVQEIVDRAGWAEGNAMMLLIEDNGSTGGWAMFSREGGAFTLPDYAAKLTVTWTHPTIARITKDVAEDAVISRTATISVTEAAAVTRTGTKDVAETAVLSTTGTKDVAEDAALTAPATKDVATDAILYAGSTQDVIGEGVITRTLTLDLAEAAAVSIDHTADVTTNASLVLGGTKDVASDAVLTAPATKDVAADAVITVTRAGLDVGCDACIAVGVHPAPGSATATLSRLPGGTATTTRLSGGRATVSRLNGGRASTTRLSGGRASESRPRGGGSANLGP